MPNSNLVNAGTEGATLGIVFKASRKDPNVDREALSFFQQNGYVVVEGMLDPAEVWEVKKAVMELAEAEQRDGKAHNYGYNMQRVWNLLDKHTIFHDLITSPQLLAWMEHLFDRPTLHQKYFLSSLQANLIRPGAPRLKLHIDTPVPEPLPPYIIKANSIWLLDEFTEANGSTEVIPGSHLRTRKPRPDDPADDAGIIKVIAPAGSVIMIHGAIWHRSGANMSSAERVVLLGSFAASYAREIACEEDIVRCLDKKSLGAMSKELKSLIGQLRLIPEDAALAALRDDFQRMIGAGMFIGEPPAFDAIIDRLRALEAAINGNGNG